MLLVLPIPLVVSLKTPWQRKIQLYALFTLGIFIIAITVIRLPININNKDLQTNRTTWASTELLTAAIVVNAPTIYGMWNKRRQKKSSGKSTNPSGLHYYGGCTHASTVHRSTVRAQGPEESFAMNSTRRKMGPMEGIMQTKEVIVSEFRQDGDHRINGRYENLPDDVENASNHSSQHGILKK